MLIPILSELRLSLQQSKARQITGRRSTRNHNDIAADEV